MLPGISPAYCILNHPRLTRLAKFGHRRLGLVAVVQIPGVGIHRRLVLLALERALLVGQVQAAEDEARLDALAREHVQVRLDVLLQRQREAAQRWHERLLGARVVEDAVCEVVGGLNAHARARELLQRRELADVGVPSLEVANHATSRVPAWPAVETWSSVCRRWQERCCCSP